MLNLIRLELKKIRISNYLISGLLTSLFLYVMICAIFIIENVFDGSYIEIFSIIESLSTFVFTIIAAFFFSNIVIGEYEKKTINVLYTYPISRKKIMLAKIILVCSFTFIMNFAMISIMYAGVYILQDFFPLFNSHISMSLILNKIIEIIIPAFCSALLTLIPLYFGLKKKSRSLTIGLSFLVCGVLNSNNNGFSLASIRMIPIAIALVAVIITYFAIIKKVEVEDIKV